MARPRPSAFKRISAKPYKRRRIVNRPEQTLQCHVADALRWLKPNCLWSSIPNEGKRSRLIGGMLKKMGMRPGMGDLVFLWSDGCGLIELKAPGETQSDNQIAVEKECIERGIRYAVCWSLDHVIDVLVRWGRLPPGTRERMRGVETKK